jgi:hypothetical protein
MIVLGIILLVLGFVLNIPVLWTIGIILLVVGAVLAVLGAAGRAVGGRKHWYRAERGRSVPPPRPGPRRLRLPGSRRGGRPRTATTSQLASPTCDRLLDAATAR